MKNARYSSGMAAGLIVTAMLSSRPAAAQGPDRGVAPPPVPVVAPGPDRAAPPPVRVAAPAAASVPARVEYRLEPGDKLRIDVYKDEQLSQSVQIRPDGKITMPLVGDIAAHGLTPLELRDRITTVLAEYVNKPVITVVVVEATAPTAYVVGEVNSPGAVVLQANMTVLQALAMVGGLKDFADEKNIRILRREASGVQTVPFDYKAAIRGGAPVYLMPGDTVIVPD